jgi:hypothetical protein
MNRALVTLRANTEAMDGSIAKQDEPAMTAQLQTVNNSLQAMQVRLRGILNDNQGPPAAQSAVEQRRASQDPDSYDEVTPETGTGTRGGKRRRKNKTAKKQRKTRKTRKTKKKRKQKGGYGYKTKQRKSMNDSDTSSSNSTLGRGRGIYKKSKKRRSARS